jgi:DNA-binding NarL/FixJ family response regulator
MIRANAPPARLIVIGILETDDHVLTSAEAGVHGYLLRSESLDQLISLMSMVVAGETRCSPKVTALLLRRVEVLAAERRPAPKVPVLTPREDQVLGLLDLGLSNQEIAGRLGIGIHTVKNHVHNVLEKAGARRRGEAVAAFRRLRGDSINAR